MLDQLRLVLAHGQGFLAVVILFVGLLMVFGLGVALIVLGAVLLAAEAWGSR